MLKRALTAGIRLYQRFLSPLKPMPTCRFLPTCSSYALEAIERRGVVVGTLKALWRILRCNPLFPGGFDPVEPYTPGSPEPGEPGAVAEPEQTLPGSMHVPPCEHEHGAAGEATQQIGTTHRGAVRRAAPASEMTRPAAAGPAHPYLSGEQYRPGLG